MSILSKNISTSLIGFDYFKSTELYNDRQLDKIKKGLKTLDPQTVLKITSPDYNALKLEALYELYKNTPLTDEQKQQTLDFDSDQIWWIITCYEQATDVKWFEMLRAKLTYDQYSDLVCLIHRFTYKDQPISAEETERIFNKYEIPEAILRISMKVHGLDSDTCNYILKKCGRDYFEGQGMEFLINGGVPKEWAAGIIGKNIAFSNLAELIPAYNHGLTYEQFQACCKKDIQTWVRSKVISAFVYYKFPANFINSVNAATNLLSISKIIRDYKRYDYELTFRAIQK